MTEPDFQVYFPDLGETRSDAVGIYGGGIPSDAAEIAAERKCQSAAEWTDHKVSVFWGTTEVTYNVSVRSEPVFWASEIFTSQGETS